MTVPLNFISTMYEIMKGTKTNLLSFCILIFCFCVHGARILSSFTETSSADLDVRTIVEVVLDNEDVLDPERSVVLLEIENVHKMDQSSANLQAELTFGSPKTTWKRTLMGYIPSNVYTDDVMQCNELKAPVMKDNDFSVSNIWREWFQRALQEEDELVWNTRVDGIDVIRRRMAGICSNLPVGSITNFTSNTFFEQEENNDTRVKDFRAREDGCKHKYAKYVGEKEGQDQWDLFCSDLRLECDSENCGLCTFSECQTSVNDCGNSFNLLSETCVAGEIVPLSGENALFNLIGIGNTVQSSDCVLNEQKQKIQSSTAQTIESAIVREKYDTVFRQAGAAYMQIFKDQKEAERQRNSIEEFVEESQNTLEQRRDELLSLAVRAEDTWNRTLEYHQNQKNNFMRFYEQFEDQQESLKNDWNKGFNSVLNEASDVAQTGAEEATLVFGFLSALDIIALDQADMIADCTESIDSLLREARVALKDVNDIRIERNDQRAATDLVWSYSTFLSNFLREPNGDPWLWWHGKASRPKGRVSLRGNAVEPWHRFTLVQQYQWDEEDEAWEKDPWIQPLKKQLEATIGLEQDITGYRARMNLENEGLGNWLDVTTFDFHVNPEYLLDNLDTWFTFNDLKSFIGPQGCFPPEIEGGTGGLKPLPPGYSEYCRGWVIVKRGRCFRKNESFWTPPNNDNIYDAFTTLNDTRFKDMADPLNACARSSSDDTEIISDNFFDRFQRDLFIASTSETFTRLPEKELVVSSALFDTYLQYLCQAPVDTVSYFNTGIFGFNSSSITGPFFEVAASASPDLCGTFESQMEVQSVQQNSLTLPYLVYKSGQLATQALSLSVQTQWEIDRFGLMPADMQGERVPFVTPYHRAHRVPSVEQFQTTSKKYFRPSRPPLEELPTFFPLKCVRYHLGFTTPYMMPLWLLSKEKTGQEVGVILRTPTNQILQNYTIDIEAFRRGGKKIPDEFLIAGYLAFAHNELIIDGEDISLVPDFQAEDLSAEVDPQLREHKATYPLFFLQKKRETSEYFYLLSKNRTEEFEPSTNLLLDQTQSMPWVLEECDTENTPCPETRYFMPQLLPNSAQNLWAEQNQIEFLDFSKVGATGGQVYRQLERNSLTGAADCKDLLAQPAVKNGSWCSLLEAEQMVRPAGAGKTLDNTDNGKVESYARKWETQLQFVVSGNALDILDRGSALYPPEERCPSTNYLRLDPNQVSTGGTSQWNVLIGNVEPILTLNMDLVFTTFHANQSSNSLQEPELILDWQAQDAWKQVKTRCKSQTIEVRYNQLLIPPQDQKSVMLPSSCHPAKLDFVLNIGDTNDRTVVKKKCASYVLQESNTRQTVIKEDLDQSQWNSDFYDESLDSSNNNVRTSEIIYPAEETKRQVEELLILEAITQRNLILLQKKFIESITGACLYVQNSSQSELNSVENADINCTRHIVRNVNLFTSSVRSNRASTNLFWIDNLAIDSDLFTSAFEDNEIEGEDTNSAELAQIIDQINQEYEDQVQRGDVITDLLDLIESQIKSINDNLVLLNESQEELTRLNQKARDAWALAAAFLANKGPYEGPIMNVDNTFLSTTVTVTGKTIITHRKLPSWNGAECKGAVLNFVCDLWDSLQDIFSSKPAKCKIFGLFSCAKCVTPREDDDSSLGFLKNWTPFGGSFWCFIYNAFAVFILIMFLRLLPTFIRIFKACFQKKN